MLTFTKSLLPTVGKVPKLLKSEALDECINQVTENYNLYFYNYVYSVDTKILLTLVWTFF